MNGVKDAYDAARETLPVLRASVNQQYNEWSDLAGGGGWLKGFIDDEFKAKGANVGHLTQAIFSVPSVLEAGDVECRAIYPVTTMVDATRATDGQNIKCGLSRAPGVMAITGYHLIIVSQMHEGWMDFVIPLEAISRPRWITIGGPLVRPKFWCLQYDSTEDGESDMHTLCLGRGYQQWVIEMITNHVSGALTLDG